MAPLHELYERHAADVYRFALYLTGDPTEAEDISVPELQKQQMPNLRRSL